MSCEGTIGRLDTGFYSRTRCSSGRAASCAPRGSASSVGLSLGCDENERSRATTRFASGHFGDKSLNGWQKGLRSKASSSRSVTAETSRPTSDLVGTFVGSGGRNGTTNSGRVRVSRTAEAGENTTLGQRVGSTHSSSLGGFATSSALASCASKTYSGRGSGGRSTATFRSNEVVSACRWPIAFYIRSRNDGANSDAGSWDNERGNSRHARAPLSAGAAKRLRAWCVLNHIDATICGEGHR